MVSFKEYPMIVKKAAIIGRENSLSNNKKNVVVTRISLISAIMAEK